MDFTGRLPNDDCEQLPAKLGSFAGYKTKNGAKVVIEKFTRKHECRDRSKIDTEIHLAAPIQLFFFSTFLQRAKSLAKLHRKSLTIQFDIHFVSKSSPVGTNSTFLYSYEWFCDATTSLTWSRTHTSQLFFPLPHSSLSEYRKCILIDSFVIWYPFNSTLVTRFIYFVCFTLSLVECDCIILICKHTKIA